jgi:hypothetical protein
MDYLVHCAIVGSPIVSLLTTTSIICKFSHDPTDAPSVKLDL